MCVKKKKKKKSSLNNLKCWLVGSWTCFSSFSLQLFRLPMTWMTENLNRHLLIILYNCGQKHWSEALVWGCSVNIFFFLINNKYQNFWSTHIKFRLNHTWNIRSICVCQSPTVPLCTFFIKIYMFLPKRIANMLKEKKIYLSMSKKTISEPFFHPNPYEK